MRRSDNFSNTIVDSSESSEFIIVDGGEDVLSVIDTNIGCGPDVYKQIMGDDIVLAGSIEENLGFSIDDEDIEGYYQEGEYTCN